MLNIIINFKFILLNVLVIFCKYLREGNICFLFVNRKKKKEKRIIRKIFIKLFYVIFKLE